MNELQHLYQMHPAIFAVILWWLFSNAVSAMKKPEATSGGGYQWLYTFLHGFAGNLATLMADKTAAVAQKTLPFVMLAVFLPLAACHGYQVHAGAPDTASSKAYDSLLVAQGVIDTAKMQLSSGALPQTFKPAINGAVVSYQLAKSSLQLYSDAVTKGQPAEIYFKNLTLDITALESKILALRGN